MRRETKTRIVAWHNEDTDLTITYLASSVFTPGERARTYGDPDDCYEGHPDEVEVWLDVLSVVEFQYDAKTGMPKPVDIKTAKTISRAEDVDLCKDFEGTTEYDAVVEYLTALWHESVER